MSQPHAKDAVASIRSRNWWRAIKRAWKAPRCSAHCKHTKAPCRNPAVKGKRVCRMHGGAKGSGAPRGQRNGAYRHGRNTLQSQAQRNELRAQTQRLRELVAKALLID